MIYDRIRELCKRNGISINELEKKIGVAKGSLCKIDKHKPSSERVKMIADTLSTSVDYIMTGEEKRYSAKMADLDTELLMMDLDVKKYALKIASLTKEKRESLFDLIDFFIDKEARK